MKHHIPERAQMQAARNYLNELGHALIGASTHPDPRSMNVVLGVLQRCAPLEAARFLRGMSARRERRRPRQPVALGRLLLVLDSTRDEGLVEEEES